MTISVSSSILSQIDPSDLAWKSEEEIADFFNKLGSQQSPSVSLPSYQEYIEAAEIEIINKALRIAGNISQAALLLRMHRGTLNKRIQVLKLQRIQTYEKPKIHLASTGTDP